MKRQRFTRASQPPTEKPSAAPNWPKGQLRERPRDRAHTQPITHDAPGSTNTCQISKRQHFPAFLTHFCPPRRSPTAPHNGTAPGPDRNASGPSGKGPARCCRASGGQQKADARGNPSLPGVPVPLSPPGPGHRWGTRGDPTNTAPKGTPAPQPLRACALPPPLPKSAPATGAALATRLTSPRTNQSSAALESSRVFLAVSQSAPAFLTAAPISAELAVGCSVRFTAPPDPSAPPKIWGFLRGWGLTRRTRDLPRSWKGDGRGTKAGASLNGGLWLGTILRGGRTRQRSGAGPS